MDTHVKLLAVVFLVLGALGVVAAFSLLLLFSGLAGLVGATSPDEADALVGVTVLGVIGTVIFFIVLSLSVPTIIAGFGLLQRHPWARLLGIVLSVLDLLLFPLGTILGVYGLWVLLSKDTEPLFRAAG